MGNDLKIYLLGLREMPSTNHVFRLKLINKVNRRYLLSSDTFTKF